MGLWVLAEAGKDLTDHSFCPLATPAGRRTRRTDEDGNPQQDFYDSEPPGVGSPASALRDAYALYYPAEERYRRAAGHWEGERAGMAHRVGAFS